MKITFIRPHLSTQKAADALEPLVFALLKGITPPDIATVLYDDRIEDIPLDDPTDLVAMTVETYTARRAYHLAAQYQQRGIPVVMGGFHPTLVPEEARQHATAIVIGDAESTWPQLLLDAQHRRLQPVYRSALLASPLRAVFDRSIFQGKRYPPVRLVQWGRGCRHQCDFCTIHTFYQGHHAQRPVADILTELEQLSGKYVLFTDDNLFVERDTFAALLKGLAALRIRWAGQISLEIAWERRLMDLLAQSGCMLVFIGFESLQPANLRQMHKSWNLARQAYEAAIKIFYEHGIMLCGTFVFGYDEDTPDSFAQCLEFTLRAKFALAHFNPLTPMPGTSLYQRIKQEGRLIHDPWWIDPAYRYGQATFQPKRMTADQLTQGCFRVRRAFNSYASILRRVLHPQANLHTWANLCLYFATNLITRQEIHTKQGIQLGNEMDFLAKKT